MDGGGAAWGCDHDQELAAGAPGGGGTPGAAACHWVAGPGIGAAAFTGIGGALTVGG
jgi:hypothetical protein